MQKTKLCKNVTEIGTFSTFTHGRKISLLVFCVYFLKLLQQIWNSMKFCVFHITFLIFSPKNCFGQLGLLTNFKAKRAWNGSKNVFSKCVLEFKFAHISRQQILGNGARHTMLNNASNSLQLLKKFRELLITAVSR
jgi:hypothetical protein